jgi:outer membrane protein
MKNVLLILNVVLLLAVGFLFYKVFAKPAGAVTTMPLVKAANDTAGGKLRVAYVELDSLDNYPYAKEVRTALRQREEQNAKELGKIRDEYTVLMKDYQQKAQQGLSQQQQSEYQEKVQMKENEYREAQQEKEQQMRNEIANRSQDLNNKIKSIIKVYAEQNNYDFIYSTNENDNIYYKTKALDITTEIVNYLNADYEKNKKK